MEQIELSKNLARVQELAKALRITPLFERLVDLKKEGLLVNPKFSFEELVIDLLENVKASRENKKVNTLLKTMDITSGVCRKAQTGTYVISLTLVLTVLDGMLTELASPQGKLQNTTLVIGLELSSL